MLKRQGLLIAAVLSVLISGAGVAYAAGEQPPAALRAAGKVTGIDLGASSFTIETLRDDELTVVVTDGTQFRSRTGEIQGLEDLEQGMPVVVAGERDAQGELVADVVGVGTPGDRVSRFRAGGEVTRISVSEGVFTLKTRADKELEIQVSDRTRFLSRDNSVQSIDDLDVGMLAQVQGLKGPEGQLHALRVAVGSPGDRPDIRATGQITAIADSSFSLETRQGRTFTFAVDATTRYRSRDGSMTSFDDLEVGMTVTVAGDELDDGKYRAIMIGVASSQRTPSGTAQAPEPLNPGV